MFNQPTLSTDLLPEEIQEFKAITLKKFGRNLSDEEAIDQLSRLVCAFEMIHKDIKDHLDISKKEGQ